MPYYHTGGRFMMGQRGRTRRGRGYGATVGYVGHQTSTWRTITNEEPSDTFEIKWPQNYQGAAPCVSQPEVLGSYSVDEDRKFGHDGSQLRFIATEYLPTDGKMEVHMDLNKSKVKPYTGNSEESFQNLLRWILCNEDILRADTSPPKLAVDFISLRSPLKKIMTTPYSFKDPWTLYATEFKGSIFLMSWGSKEKDRSWMESPSKEEISRWGHTFERYVTGGNPKDDLQCNEEYRCVLRTMMDQTSLLYAPEIDCANPELYEEDYRDLSGFITVKCCRELIEPFKLQSYKRYKLLNYWVEGKLSGVPSVVVGYRNDDGIVHTVEQLKIDEIPNIAEGVWEPGVCLNFFELFLAFVKGKVMANPGAVYRFDKIPKGNIHWSKLAASSHTTILPSWFTEELFSSEDTKNKRE